MTYNVNSPKIFSMFQLNSSPYEVLADICAPGFAVIDWFLTRVISTSGSIGGVSSTGFGVVFVFDELIDANNLSRTLKTSYKGYR
uniref:Uncharacterized protein n=1 Tax=Rhizophagus irregularis (strain DAOM 181602 / DAOM 197198 / MUCL 43194) TaxID=747089 RepID=U9TI33_RHIID